MRYLYNRRGDHIANDVDGELHSPTGTNLGHYLEEERIFIDADGDYVGEVLYENRLVFYRNSPFRNANFGNRGNHGHVGNYGSQGNRGAVSLPSGYEDIDVGKAG